MIVQTESKRSSNRCWNLWKRPSNQRIARVFTGSEHLVSCCLDTQKRNNTRSQGPSFHSPVSTGTVRGTGCGIHLPFEINLNFFYFRVSVLLHRTQQFHFQLMKYLKYLNVIFPITRLLDCSNIAGKSDRCSWSVEKTRLDIKVIWVLSFLSFASSWKS